MAILNSHLVWWFLKNTGTVLANGYYRYKPAYLKPFPMANFSSTSLKYLEETVDKLTADSLSEKDKNILTNRTNDIIYKEYSLSDDEIAYIESTI